MVSPNYIFNQPITLTNCDLEPIHIPNAIQPHGILMIFNEINWQILQVSDNNVIQMIKISQADAQINFHIPQPLPIIKGDRLLTEEIFVNLINNAIKYNDQPEKRIEIGCVMARPDWSLIDHPGFDQDLPVFYVKDNGIGIKEKHFDPIFRIFKRLHSQNKYGGGTGAGLTIVKKIIERHGGQIWLESKYKEERSILPFPHRRPA